MQENKDISMILPCTDAGGYKTKKARLAAIDKWKAIAKLIEEYFDKALYAFDPDFCFCERGGKLGLGTLTLPADIAIKIARLIEENKALKEVIREWANRLTFGKIVDNGNGITEERIRKEVIKEMLEVAKND